jgi:hypothetical protein
MYIVMLVCAMATCQHHNVQALFTAPYTHQNCVRVVPPEDGQVMPETCRGFEF